MNPDLLSPHQVLAPLIIVAGVLMLPKTVLPMDRPWARAAIAAFVGLVVVRYLAWRVTTTLDLDGLGTLEGGWVMFCFGVEMFALFDAAILYLIFLRTSDRRPEADRHERRMRALAPADLPSVDVFIATYNEPLAVVEKTIVGALALDYPNFQVWVLDDGRRGWLRDFCLRKGVGYITRPDNEGAKAGNLNHALARTDGDFVMVLDADFITQRNFLMRAMGFFEDPKIGIVQIPHTFYNNDPMQVNLGARKALPDDQRFFFEAIMPSRDAWDAAFCCGSNSITRRSALERVGGELSSDSITEDMLLSLNMLREGFVTRYLNEPLAYGLAPESVSAFFVQRQRWARGGIQILHLDSGPLRRGLRLVHQLMFLPTHWLSQSLMLVTSIMAPLLFLLFGLTPLTHVTVEAALFYLFPMVLASIGGLVAFAPGRYFPLASQVLGMFQSFKLLPTVISTLFRPHGHRFRVTPKGGPGGSPGWERGIFTASTTLLVLTFSGIVINAMPDLRIVEPGALIPLVAFWGTVNCVLLMLVAMLCLQAGVRRGEERFTVDETMLVLKDDGRSFDAPIIDLSVSGTGLTIPEGISLDEGETISVVIREVGPVRGWVARKRGNAMGVAFHLPESIERDRLIRKIFTSGLNTIKIDASTWSVLFELLKRIFTLDASLAARAALTEPEAVPEEKLPSVSLLVPPTHRMFRVGGSTIKRPALAA